MTNPLQKTENELLNRESLARKLAKKGLSLDAIDKEFLEVTGEPFSISPIEICLEKFITGCPVIIAIKDKIRKLAPTNLPVLIIGESGTGKELLARALHGSRPNNKFIDVNCAGIPDTLLESEFFGAAKGAFTGCDKDRTGYLQEAYGGTLFLDEIGDMPLLLQAKLLRVIQEGEARRLGDSRNYKVSCRFISATNRTVTELINNKNIFRQDLFYRLAGIVLGIPPLKNRRDDIELIVKGLGYAWPQKWPANAQDYNWPGNVRELINMLEADRIINNS